MAFLSAFFAHHFSMRARATVWSGSRIKSTRSPASLLDRSEIGSTMDGCPLPCGADAFSTTCIIAQEF